MILRRNKKFKIRAAVKKYSGELLWTCMEGIDSDVYCDLNTSHEDEKDAYFILMFAENSYWQNEEDHRCYYWKNKRWFGNTAQLDESHSECGLSTCSPCNEPDPD